MDGRNPTRTLKLESACDLLCALGDPSRKLREAVLKAIIANPRKALDLGSFQGQDVIDELVHQASNGCSVPYYRLLVRALSGFEDPRVRLLFTKIALLARDSEILQLVESRLAAVPLPVEPCDQPRERRLTDHPL
jgi:hypothetical protein